MKKREKKIVITFHTTTDAMAMERYCKKRKEPGRLIPVPGTISAGCGLAWCSAAREGTSFESDGGGGYNSAGCA